MLKNQNNQETEEEIQKKQSETLEAPTKLMQYYMVVELRDKIDVLFSFLKAHQKQKILIFFSTCKQVKPL
jgi:ATP-dependent RNA helicase DDX10/DBP4